MVIEWYNVIPLRIVWCTDAVEVTMKSMKLGPITGEIWHKLDGPVEPVLNTMSIISVSAIWDNYSDF